MAKHRPVDPASPQARPARTAISRRRFITGVGAGTAVAAVALRVQPSWKPTLPNQTAGSFVMTDLLRFARVDPASRGQ